MWSIDFGNGASVDSEVRFWRTIPREFRAFGERVAERERRQDNRAGQIAAILLNTNRDPQRTPQPYQASDVFPSLSHVPQQPAYRASDDEVAAGWQSWALHCQTVQGGG